MAMVPQFQFTYWQWASLTLASPVVVWGAWPFHRAAWVNIRHGAVTMDTLVSVGVTLSGFSGIVLAFGSSGEALGPTGRYRFAVLLVNSLGAAFLGDQLAYFIGHKAGPRLFSRPDSKIFKQQYIDQTYKYFDKYGGRTIIVARFVPIVRTFVPTVAGVSSMRYRTFVLYNVIGGVLWGGGVTTLGYFLGEIEIVKNNIELAAIAIVGLVIFPTDPGWSVVSVPGRLHPIFALIAAISLLDAGSLLAHKGRLLRDWALFWASGFVGGFAGGPGFAERLALAVVGVLLFLGARRSR